jgi:hypothetical protein
MHVSASMHLKIKTCMFEQLSKPLKMDGIQISLLDVACLTFTKNLSLDEDIQHCCHCFQL